MPKRTIELLDQLEGLGFSNDDFRALHHFDLERRREPIQDMRDYCEKVGAFHDDGTNERVRERLGDCLGGIPGRKFLSPC
jgi:hypothetical protein